MKSLLYILFISFCCIPFASAQRKRIKDPIPREVEKIYTKGLKYLSQKQNKDGTWDGDSYGKNPGCVGLAILAFLAHGDDPNHGPYAKNVKRSIDYLLKCQQKNGYLGQAKGSHSAHGGMYAHGFATLSLAEAYGMVDDKRIGPALKKAVALILTSQKRNTHGAWRYSPDSTSADSTVAGCQIVALYAARNAGIPVPDDALTKAMKYMEKCRNKSNGSYGYTSAGGGRPTLSSIGLLCRSLAKEKDTKSYKLTLKYLTKNLNHRETHYKYYWEYYMSQALFQADEKIWQQWNLKNIKYIGSLQQPDGSLNGDFGKVYSTSSALLSLALNYRFLPIYEK